MKIGQALERLDGIGQRIDEENVTAYNQRDLYSAIGEASALQLRDGRLLQRKIGEPQQQPVVIRTYEELQEKSTALRVEVQGAPEQLHTGLDQVGAPAVGHQAIGRFNRSIEVSVDRSINQSIRQPINRSIN